MSVCLHSSVAFCSLNSRDGNARRLNISYYTRWWRERESVCVCVCFDNRSKRLFFMVLNVPFILKLAFLLFSGFEAHVRWMDGSTDEMCMYAD